MSSPNESLSVEGVVVSSAYDRSDSVYGRCLGPLALQRLRAHMHQCGFQPGRFPLPPSGARFGELAVRIRFDLEASGQLDGIHA
jgi:hypothetical protein